MVQTGLFDSPRFNSLDEVLEAIRSLKNDPLADAGTNIVISRGNPQAKLLLVGEAPGPQENIKGKPFVGPAGQLLDKILQAANFDPET
ncbi:MAG: uracil-DNA glycosylase, partial [Anaerolineales bacterium]|nr:uracil-DNA glycosylase [Anaerolineales bacterium]